MNMKLLLGAGAALALGVSAPAFAQSAGSTVTGGKGDTLVKTEQTTINANINASRTQTMNSVRNPNSVRTSTELTSLNYSNSSQRNGNVHLVADQNLDQHSNAGGMNFTGRHADYSTGANHIEGASFAAFSGILNQGWNTGNNSNSAAATNIAANGTTTFTGK